jgi:hypothetical protein
MRTARWHICRVSIFLVLGTFALGCGQTHTTTGGVKDQGSKTAGEESQVADAVEGHDHSGWWCAEPGIPRKFVPSATPNWSWHSKKREIGVRRTSAPTVSDSSTTRS